MHERSDADVIGLLDAVDPAVVAEAAGILGSRRVASAGKVLLRLLSRSNHAIVRNACAIALMDLEEAARIPVLAQVLADPRTAGSRGSLVYALGGADVRHLLPLLTELVLTGHFEACAEARNIIEEMVGPLDPALVRACSARVGAHRRSGHASRDVEWLWDGLRELTGASP